MTDSTQPRTTTFGDAAVDGLISGAIAGVIMAAYLLVASLTWGDSLITTLGRFDPSGAASPVTGSFTHLAVSAVYGAIFALVWRLIGRWARIPVWAAALAYGLLLWILATVVLLPSASSPLLAIPPLHFGLAHGLYGAVLGIGLARRK